MAASSVNTAGASWYFILFFSFWNDARDENYTRRHSFAEGGIHFESDFRLDDGWTLNFFNAHNLNIFFINQFSPGTVSFRRLGFFVFGVFEVPKIHGQIQVFGLWATYFLVGL